MHVAILIFVSQGHPQITSTKAFVATVQLATYLLQVASYCCVVSFVSNNIFIIRTAKKQNSAM